MIYKVNMINLTIGKKGKETIKRDCDEYIRTSKPKSHLGILNMIKKHKDWHCQI